MVDVTTCKLVGDASLNNDSFIHCVIYWLLQISIIGQICSFIWTRRNKKAFSFRGRALPPDPPPGALLPGPLLGAPPPAPVIGSRSALAIEFEPYAVLNWSLKSPIYALFISIRSSAAKCFRGVTTVSLSVDQRYILLFPEIYYFSQFSVYIRHWPSETISTCDGRSLNRQTDDEPTERRT